MAANNESESFFNSTFMPLTSEGSTNYTGGPESDYFFNSTFLPFISEGSTNYTDPPESEYFFNSTFIPLTSEGSTNYTDPPESEYFFNSTFVPTTSQASVNCTNPLVDSIIKIYFLPTMYSIIFIVGFPGNIISISVYVMKMRPWRTSIIILLNLAITDLLHLCSLPFLVYNYVNEEKWTLGDFMCKLIRVAFHFNLYGSILFLTCFSIFRFFVIVHPMKFHSIHKRRWAVIACAAVWIIALIEVLPMVILMKDIQDTAACMDFAVSFDTYNVRWYNACLTSIGFAIPLLVVTLSYTAINCSLGNGPYTNDAHKKKARRLVVILLVVFYACFLPLHIFRAIRIETRLYPVGCIYEKHIHAAYIASRPIASLNTFGNLLLYVAVGGNFQQAIQSVYKANPYKHQP